VKDHNVKSLKSSVKDDEGAGTMELRCDSLFIRGKSERSFKLLDEDRRDLFEKPEVVKDHINQLFVKVKDSEDNGVSLLQKFKIDHLNITVDTTLEFSKISEYRFSFRVAKEIESLKGTSLEFICNNFHDIVISLLGEISRDFEQKVSPKGLTPITIPLNGHSVKTAMKSTRNRNGKLQDIDLYFGILNCPETGHKYIFTMTFGPFDPKSHDDGAN